MMTEVVVGHGCVLGCHLLMWVFCEGSCVSEEDAEPHLHLHEKAHLRCHLMGVVCMVEEEVVQKCHHLLVRWKTEAASWC